MSLVIHDLLLFLELFILLRHKIVTVFVEMFISFLLPKYGMPCGN